MLCRCEVSDEEFDVTDSEIQLYQRAGLPIPRLSPFERQRRRMRFRNFRNLYYLDCPVTKERMLSMYRAGVAFPVWSNRAWWSDNWSAFDYGREVDLSRSFIEQYRELNEVVPRFSLMQVNCENSDYSNFAYASRNCYLVFGCVRNEDCLYGHIVWDSKNCVDTLYAFECQWCSHGVDIAYCYDVHFAHEAVNCHESYFLFDCINCKNCFGCYNLRNQQYCLMNKQLSRSEYESEMKKLFPLTPMTIEKMSQWLASQRAKVAVAPEIFAIRTENVSGNHIYESSQLNECFDAKRCENSSHCYTAFNVENSIDISFSAATTRFCIDCLTLTNCERCITSHLLVDCSDVAYSEFCFSSQNLLGCNGLRRASYCILNRQYSKEDYFKLRERIISGMKQRGEWGEFLPECLSPFTEAESIASDYLGQELLEGFVPEHSPMFSAELNSDDPLLAGTTFTCKATGKKFKFNGPELLFYRRMQLPLPQVSPEYRYLKRLHQRATRKIHYRRCASCSTELATAHDQQFASRLLCQNCYRKTQET